MGVGKSKQTKGLLGGSLVYIQARTTVVPRKVLDCNTHLSSQWLWLMGIGSPVLRGIEGDILPSRDLKVGSHPGTLQFPWLGLMGPEVQQLYEAPGSPLRPQIRRPGEEREVAQEIQRTRGT